MTENDALHIRRVTRRALTFAGISAIIFFGGFFAFSLVTNRQAVLAAVRILPISLLATIAALALANYLLRAYRFQLFAKRLGLSASFTDLTVYYFAGFAMTMSPGKLGEAIRLWFLKRHYGFGYHKGMALQIADRLGDVYAAVLLCVIGLANFAQLWSYVFLMLGGLVALSALLIWPRRVLGLVESAGLFLGIKLHVIERLDQMVRNTSFLFRPAVFLPGLVLSLIGWYCECYALFLILEVMQTPIGLPSAIFIFAFASIAGALTMLPGGLGGVELTMFGLLVLNGVSADMAAVTTAVLRLGTLWFGTGLGFVALFLAMRMSKRRRAAV